MDELWHVLLDLSQVLPFGWTLVGGQMVLLHALEHARTPIQVSQDGDVVADVRADQRGIAVVVAALEERGFDLEGISTDGLAPRYVRGEFPRQVKIDVLAPEGLGPRADLTTSRPGRTLEVPGGSQALARTEHVEVLHEGRSALVPRPSLLGAIVVKAAACALPGDNSRHHRDLAQLCTLVDDPYSLRSQMDSKDRARVRLAHRLQDERHLAWALVTDELDRLQGQATFQILTES